VHALVPILVPRSRERGVLRPPVSTPRSGSFAVTYRCVGRARDEPARPDRSLHSPLAMAGGLRADRRDGGATRWWTAWCCGRATGGVASPGQSPQVLRSLDRSAAGGCDGLRRSQ
jgi:hypothetical protein